MSREWVRARLENWARWLVQRVDGGLGYPKVNILQLQRGTPASTDQVPVNAIEAQQTHEAVQSLRAHSMSQWEALMYRYIGDPHAPASKRREMSHSEIGRAMGVTERTSREWLTDAELAVDMALTRQTAQRVLRNSEFR